MAVVAGVVFSAVRVLLALMPDLAVSFPIKKWSAAAALAASALSEPSLTPTSSAIGSDSKTRPRG
jgi:hypothetical protein